MALPNWLTPILMLLFYTHLEVQFNDQKGKVDQNITLAPRQIILLNRSKTYLSLKGISCVIAKNLKILPVFEVKGEIYILLVP